jgi:hypothetical protein
VPALIPTSAQRVSGAQPIPNLTLLIGEASLPCLRQQHRALCGAEPRHLLLPHMPANRLTSASSTKFLFVPGLYQRNSDLISAGSPW